MHEYFDSFLARDASDSIRSNRRSQDTRLCFHQSLQAFAKATREPQLPCLHAFGLQTTDEPATVSSPEETIRDLRNHIERQEKR